MSKPKVILKRGGEWHLVSFGSGKGLSIPACNSHSKCCSHHLSTWIQSWETKFMVADTEVVVVFFFPFENNSCTKETNKKGGKKKNWIYRYSSSILCMCLAFLTSHSKHLLNKFGAILVSGKMFWKICLPQHENFLKF